jgi:menaquinone-dependent protoporphyrinogen oxidase
MLRSRVLVLYGTTDGHTRKIATTLAETLRAAELEVDVVNAQERFDPDPEHYDGVIVAASVRGGRFQRAVRQWANRHAVSLKSRPTAFVAVCLSVLDRSPKTAVMLDGILQRFFDESHWRPPVTKIVAGALLYTRYNWIMRWIMRRIVAKAHGDTDTSRDYEYTDWEALRAFARQFAFRLIGKPVMPVAV